jgi:hypothetical protein
MSEPFLASVASRGPGTPNAMFDMGADKRKGSDRDPRRDATNLLEEQNRMSMN